MNVVSSTTHQGGLNLQIILGNMYEVFGLNSGDYELRMIPTIEGYPSVGSVLHAGYAC